MLLCAGGAQDHSSSIQLSILCLQGEVLLRDGNHVTDMDVRFKVEGFYVRDSGRLYAVLQPARSLKVKLTKKEIKEGGPDYR